MLKAWYTNSKLAMADLQLYATLPAGQSLEVAPGRQTWIPRGGDVNSSNPTFSWSRWPSPSVVVVVPPCVPFSLRRRFAGIGCRDLGVDPLFPPTIMVSQRWIRSASGARDG